MMTLGGLIILVVVGAALFVAFSLVNRMIMRDSAATKAGAGTRSKDLTTLAQQLRREAASTPDPRTRENLIRMAEEMEADAVRAQRRQAPPEG